MARSLGTREGVSGSRCGVAGLLPNKACSRLLKAGATCLPDVVKVESVLPASSG